MVAQFARAAQRREPRGPHCPSGRTERIDFGDARSPYSPVPGRSGPPDPPVRGRHASRSIEHGCTTTIARSASHPSRRSVSARASPCTRSARSPDHGSATRPVAIRTTAGIKSRWSAGQPGPLNDVHLGMCFTALRRPRGSRVPTSSGDRRWVAESTRAPTTARNSTYATDLGRLRRRGDRRLSTNLPDMHPVPRPTAASAVTPAQPLAAAANAIPTCWLQPPSSMTLHTDYLSPGRGSICPRRRAVT